MIDIEKLKMLTQDGIERNKIVANESKAKASIEAKKIFDNKVQKLAEEAANRGESSAIIYECSKIRNRTSFSRNHLDSLDDVGQSLYHLCEDAGLKPCVIEHREVSSYIRIYW